MKSNTRRMAFCSVLSAVAVILLTLGLIIPTLDIVSAMLASFTVILTVCELGRAYSLPVFCVSATLALILMPQNGAVLIYAAFVGYYPIIKSLIETKVRNKPAAILLKQLSFSVAFAAIIFIAVKFLAFEQFIGWYSLVIVVLGEIAFVLYDILLTRMIFMYFRNLRHRLGLARFLRK